MVTIHEIAEKCGVSSATISRVMNNKDVVNPKTRKRILKTIDELGYVPNRSARSLKNQESKVLNLILPNNLNPLQNEIAKHIEDYARQRGYDLMLGVSGGDEAIEQRYMQIALERQVDGIFLTPFSFNEKSDIFTIFKKRKVPVVALHKIIGVNDIDYVTLDEYAGAYQVTEHLLKLGHRNIAFVAGVSNLTLAQERIDGIIGCCRDNGCDYDRELIYRCENTVESGYYAASNLLKQRDKKITAIFALNDLLAIGVYKAVVDAKMSIPKDISVVGFDNIFISEYLVPPLTTVTFDKELFARTAVDFLVNRIESLKNGNPLEYQQRIIKPEVIVRDSSC